MGMCYPTPPIWILPLWETTWFGFQVNIYFLLSFFLGGGALELIKRFDHSRSIHLMHKSKYRGLCKSC